MPAYDAMPHLVHSLIKIVRDVHHLSRVPESLHAIYPLLTKIQPWKEQKQVDSFFEVELSTIPGAGLGLFTKKTIETSFRLYYALSLHLPDCDLAQGHIQRLSIDLQDPNHEGPMSMMLVADNRSKAFFINHASGERQANATLRQKKTDSVPNWDGDVHRYAYADVEPGTPADTEILVRYGDKHILNKNQDFPFPACLPTVVGTCNCSKLLFLRYLS